MKLKTVSFLLLFFLTFASYAQERTITDIHINGLKKTKLNVIKSFINLKPNTVLDSVLIDEDIIRLKRLPSVSHAYYKILETATGSFKVDYFIEENRTLIPVVNFWTTTNKQFAYKLGVYEYNFLGRNMAFGGYYQNNGYHSYEVNFRAPFLFSNRLGLSVNHQNWTSEEPLYFGNDFANYKYQNISLETLLMFQANLKNNFEFGVNYFKEIYNYKSGITSPTIPQQLNINKLLFKFIYTYDNLAYNYQYINGFKSQLFVQMVTTKNEFQDDFFIAWNDLFYFKKIGVKGNWANRLRVGLATNNESPFAPFALDNNVNLRGVGILVDRGTGSIVYNTEYRHTIIERGSFIVQSNLFTDFGTWRNPGGKLSDFVQSKNMKVFSGVGLRIINKKVFNATFRIDYGFELTNGKSQGLVFGIGQYF